MQFSKLAQHFEKIESTSSRIEITTLLSEFFSQLTAEEISIASYMMEGRLAPLYKKKDFIMSDKMVVKSLLSLFNIDQKTYKETYRTIGDIGKTFEHIAKQQPRTTEKELSIEQVYDALSAIPEISGEGSQERKQHVLAELVSKLDPLAIRYVTRIPTGVMRLGFSDKTVLDAFSWMMTGDKSLRKQIEAAYHVRPDLGYIGYQLKKNGIKSIQQIEPTLFTPILMMRAERLSSGSEIVDKIGECMIEPKYDGFRLQIHYDAENDFVELYTRGLENVTDTYPDVVEITKRQCHATSAIFEGEAIGFDPHTGTLLPFQETVQRKRKYDIAEKAKEIPLQLFVFDMLYKNGTSLLHSSYRDRRKVAESTFSTLQADSVSKIIVAKAIKTDDPRKIETQFDQYITNGLEGIIAKRLEGLYQAGARGWNWIKLKKSYAASALNDTIDCVVMGYDYGQGKRVEFGIGAFLAGVYDSKNDIFVTIGKIGTGLTDEEWKQLKQRADVYKSLDQPHLYSVDAAMAVDVWIEPSIVVEIRADEITRSSVHTAGRIMQPSKSGTAEIVKEAGYALRFPRLERFRDDKTPTSVTTVEEVRKMA